MKRNVVTRLLSVLLLALLMVAVAAPASAAAQAEAKSAKAWRYTHVVMSDGLRLRSSPKGGVMNVLGSMKKGTKVRYIAKNGGWWKVGLSNGKVGYCYGTYLGLAGYSINKNYYSTKKITVYKAASGGSTKGTLKAGVVVKLLGKSYNRGYIRAVINGKYHYGYVSLKTLRRA